MPGHIAHLHALCEVAERRAARALLRHDQELAARRQAHRARHMLLHRLHGRVLRLHQQGARTEPLQTHAGSLWREATVLPHNLLHKIVGMHPSCPHVSLASTLLLLRRRFAASEHNRKPVPRNPFSLGAHKV